MKNKTETIVKAANPSKQTGTHKFRTPQPTIRYFFSRFKEIPYININENYILKSESRQS